MRWQLFWVAVLVACSLRSWAAEPNLGFQPAGDRLFDFNTGVVKGQLRGNGQYQGISSFVDLKTGKELTRSAGIFSYYRILSQDKRWGKAARDWPMTAQLLPDGAVRIDWIPQEDHPLAMTAIYRWASPTTLDLETLVQPKVEMPKFEVFLSSYFDLSLQAYPYVQPLRPQAEKPTFMAAECSALVKGSYLAFPIDRQSAQMFFDRRWAPEHGYVPFSVSRMLEVPMVVKRDDAKTIGILLMSRPGDCFGMSMSYHLDPPDGIAGHGSIYISLFGKDLAAGQSARACVRLVIEHSLTDERAVELYREYVQQMQ